MYLRGGRQTGSPRLNRWIVVLSLVTYSLCLPVTSVQFRGIPPWLEAAMGSMNKIGRRGNTAPASPSHLQRKTLVRLEQS